MKVRVLQNICMIIVHNHRNKSITSDIRSYYTIPTGTNQLNAEDTEDKPNRFMIQITITLYLHGEVGVRVVVCDYIADSLVYHGKEGSECSEAGEVHDMV